MGACSQEQHLCWEEKEEGEGEIKMECSHSRGLGWPLRELRSWDGPAEVLCVPELAHMGLGRADWAPLPNFPVASCSHLELGGIVLGIYNTVIGKF